MRDVYYRNNKLARRNGAVTKKKLKKKKGFAKKSHLARNNVEGFTIIGEVETGAAKKVERVLPDWLANPSIVTVNLQTDVADLSEAEIHLKPVLLSKLEEHGIQRFFPVQSEVC